MTNDIRILSEETITQTVAQLCQQANTRLPADVLEALENALQNEDNDIAKYCLQANINNAKLANESSLPICQDTGMAMVFLEWGNRVVVDGDIIKAINKGVSVGYTQGYLRASVTPDPLFRSNTEDNTPAIVHIHPVLGDTFKITIAPKGFGAENMSRLFMLTPASQPSDIVARIVETMKDAGGNPCPPVVLGVGIGGSAEQAMLAAKMQLLRPLNAPNPDPRYEELEKESLEAVNQLKIGPQGLGGKTTALCVHIQPLPTHIAGLPLGINVCCHVLRRASAIV
jgi:fumarate hydratase subunit alpha